jgi:hypothetical protein
MVFFIDDIFLRMLGFSIPPFDMIWLMELLYNYSYQTMTQENLERINNLIKENRLLYELGEKIREEYETTAEKLNYQRKILDQEKGINLNYRINALGS